MCSWKVGGVRVLGKTEEGDWGGEVCIRGIPEEVDKRSGGGGAVGEEGKKE